MLAVRCSRRHCQLLFSLLFLTHNSCNFITSITSIITNIITNIITSIITSNWQPEENLTYSIPVCYDFYHFLANKLCSGDAAEREVQYRLCILPSTPFNPSSFPLQTSFNPIKVCDVTLKSVARLEGVLAVAQYMNARLVSCLISAATVYKNAGQKEKSTVGKRQQKGKEKMHTKSK